MTWITQCQRTLMATSIFQDHRKLRLGTGSPPLRTSRACDRWPRQSAGRSSPSGDPLKARQKAASTRVGGTRRAASSRFCLFSAQRQGSIGSEALSLTSSVFHKCCHRTLLDQGLTMLPRWPSCAARACRARARGAVAELTC